MGLGTGDMECALGGCAPQLPSPAQGQVVYLVNVFLREGRAPDKGQLLNGLTQGQLGIKGEHAWEVMP